MADFAAAASAISTMVNGATSNAFGLVNIPGQYEVAKASASLGKSSPQNANASGGEPWLGALSIFFRAGLMLNTRFMSAVMQGSISQGSTATAAMRTIAAPALRPN